MGILMEATERNLEVGGYRPRRGDAQPQLFGAHELFAGAVHAIAISTRETEFGSIIEPVPITLDAYRQLQRAAIATATAGQRPPHHAVPTAAAAAPAAPTPAQHQTKETLKVAPPPKKKWIKEYLEEEPKSPVSVRAATGPPPPAARVNGVVRASPPPAPAPAPAPDPPAPQPAPALLLDFVQEHSRPRTNTNSHGGAATPSPPSAGSGSSSSGGGGGGGRAGTREVHNKLEKNRRAHLKECFELLKRQLPTAQDDKKTSNLSILGSAIRYIQVLRRKERECEHEMERLAREKIAAQQRLAALRRDVPSRPARRAPPSPPRPPPQALCAPEAVSKDNVRDESVNGQVLGIPLSITPSPPPAGSRAEASPPGSLNLSTKLRTLPVQISPTTSQVVRTSFARHSTLTLTALAAPDHSHQGAGAGAGALRPAEGALMHLPLSPVVGGVGGGLVVGGALQLVGAPLRLLAHHPHPHAHAHAHAHAAGVTTIENNRIPKENGVVSPPPSSAGGAGGVGGTAGGAGLVVGGLPLVVSQPHLLHSTLTHHKVVESQVVRNGVAVSAHAQYLSTALVKPVVVVSAAHDAHAHAHPPRAPAPAAGRLPA